MRRGHKGVFKAAIAALELDLVRHEADAARTRDLITALMARAGVEGRNSSPEKLSVPPKRKPQRTKRRRRKPVAARKRTPAVPVPVAVPASGKGAKAVKGAAVYASELKAIDGIVSALAVAETALTSATRGKDAAGIAAASEHIQRLRSEGGQLLIRIGGRAKLSIGVVERRRWRAAADKAAALSAPKPKPKRRVTPSRPPVRKIDSGWTEDAAGIRSREIHAVEEHR